MGIALSLNYSNITPHFNYGIWKVSKAIHKSTNRPVSLWIIDYAIMKERERNKKNRRNYIQFLLEAIQNQQKIQHINILRIFEVQAAKKKIGFSSEQIETNLCINVNEKFTRDESIYITQQIATTMRYVHDSLHIAFMGIYPENIFLNSHLTLKLGMFIHSSVIQTDLSKITDPFITFSPGSIFHLPINWVAPEVIKNDTITSRAECYMYGLMCVYIFTGTVPSKTSSPQSIDLKGPIELCNSIPEEFQTLMKNCLSGDPASRPNFDSITQDDAFSSLIARIFQYIEIIKDKSDRDLFNFFKGLKIAINAFSDRIIKQKFMPLFIYYVRKDARFSYALLPIFFRCITKYNISEYIEKVLRPIKSVMTQFENPKVNSLTLDYVGMLLKRIPSEFHEELVFPIVFSAFKTSDMNVVMSSLQMMPGLINLMKVSLLRSDTVPNLLRLAESSQVPDIVILTVNLITLIMKKTGPDFIAETAFPVLSRAWRKMQWPKLADALADLVQLCDVPVELLFSTTLQMALLIISNPKVSASTHARMIVFVQKALAKISKEYRISNSEFETASKYVPAPPELTGTKINDILEEEEDEEDNESSNQDAQLSFLNNIAAEVRNQSTSSSAQQQTGSKTAPPLQQQNDPFANTTQPASSFYQQQKLNDPPSNPFGSQTSTKQQKPNDQPSNPFGSQASTKQQKPSDAFINPSSSASFSLGQQPSNPFGSANSFSSFQQPQDRTNNSQASSSFYQFESSSSQPPPRSPSASNSFQFSMQPSQDQAARRSNRNSSFQFTSQPSQQSGQPQQAHPLQSNTQYSSSFDIFNQTPQNSFQQSQNSSSFDIFRNVPPSGCQSHQEQKQQQINNNNSYQTFPQYQPQQQRGQNNPANPYDNNINSGYNPYDF